MYGEGIGGSGFKKDGVAGMYRSIVGAVLLALGCFHKSLISLPSLTLCFGGA